MTWAQYLYSYVKNQSIYTAGRWLLSLGMVAAAVTSPTWPVVLLMVGASGALQGVLTWRKQVEVEDQLVSDYRDELSAKTGVGISKLTTQELHTVAYGDADKNIDANPVLAQAIERSTNRKLMTWGSTIAAAFSVMALFAVFSDQVQPISKFILEHITSAMHAIGLGGVAPANSGIFAIMLVSGTGMGLINNVFDRVTERVIGFNRRTAHEQIQEIRRDIDKNQIIIPQQVFGVFVAINPKLDQQINAMYRRPYEKLNLEEQHDAMLIFGRDLQSPLLNHHTIASLTRDLNSRQIEADELAFAVVNQNSGVPRLETPQARGKVKSELQEFVQEVKQVVRGQKRYDAEEQRAQERQLQEQVEQAPSNDNIPGFAQRFTPRELAETSHVERAGRAPRDTSQSFLEQEMQRLIEGLNQEKNQDKIR